jgi:hypothetical protein
MKPETLPGLKQNFVCREFPTAIKRVSWSEDDTKIALVTEQRMGHQGAVRVFEINRDGGPRKSSVFQLASLSILSATDLTEVAFPRFMDYSKND